MLKDKILMALLENRDTVVSGGLLSRRFGVSRTAVSRSVAALVSEGNDIEILKNRGYCLRSASDRLSAERIGSKLKTETFGRKLEILRTVSSTNTELKRRAPEGLPEGFALLSEEQTGGRGRFSRQFLSPEGAGIYLSILLRPEIAGKDTPLITLLAAVAASRAVERTVGIRPGIKWVNDLYVGEKKLGGILTEGSVIAESGEIESVILGIGLNTGKVPESLAGIATSTWEETGVLGIRNALAAELLNALEEEYRRLSSGRGAEVVEEYRRRMMILGRTVLVTRGKEQFPARVLDIGEAGELIVQTESGEELALSSGEVSLHLDEGRENL